MTDLQPHLQTSAQEADPWSDGLRTERFNRSRLTRPDSKHETTYISEGEIANSPGLFRASLNDAAMYGGEAIREALSALKVRGNRRHITVDAKVHMLMPGMVPAIPGWHTDGVPRSDDGSPSGSLEPDLTRQENRNSPIYHLFLAGCDAPTVFLENRDVELDVPVKATPDLYALITKAMSDRQDVTRIEITRGQWWTWDWWELHSAQPSREKGWRLLIRVTESDFLKPETDLRRVLRTHQQAYINGAFGW